MSDDVKRDNTGKEIDTAQSRSNGPSFVALSARDVGEKTYYNRVGAAFPHKDGEGHTVDLESVPVNGRIILRTPKDRLQSMKDGTGAAQERRSQERGR